MRCYYLLWGATCSGMIRKIHTAPACQKLVADPSAVSMHQLNSRRCATSILCLGLRLDQHHGALQSTRWETVLDAGHAARVRKGASHVGLQVAALTCEGEALAVLILSASVAAHLGGLSSKIVEHVAGQILVRLRRLETCTRALHARNPAGIGKRAQIAASLQMAGVLEIDEALATLRLVAQGTAVVHRGISLKQERAQELPAQICVDSLGFEIRALGLRTPHTRDPPLALNLANAAALQVACLPEIDEARVALRPVAQRAAIVNRGRCLHPNRTQVVSGQVGVGEIGLEIRTRWLRNPHAGSPPIVGGCADAAPLQVAGLLEIDEALAALRLVAQGTAIVDRSTVLHPD